MATATKTKKITKGEDAVAAAVAAAAAFQAKLKAQEDAKVAAKLSQTASKTMAAETLPTTKAEALKEIQEIKTVLQLQKEEQDARDSIFPPAITITPTAPTPKTSNPDASGSVAIAIAEKATVLPRKEPKAKKAPKPKAEPKPKAVKAPKPKAEPKPKAVKAPKVTMKDLKTQAFEMFKQLGYLTVTHTADIRKKGNDTAHFVDALNLTRKADWQILCDRLAAKLAKFSAC